MKKESISVYKIIGARDNGDKVKAVDEGEITVDLDMNNPKDILVSKGDEGYDVTFGGGILVMKITDKAVHALVKKLEGIEAKG